MSIARDGYVFVPTSVDGATLDVLREEADHLFHLKKAHDALSEDEYFDKGCALDFFTNNELSEGDGARTSVDAYMSRRNGAVYRRAHSNPTLSARGFTGRPTRKRAKQEAKEDVDAATGVNDNNDEPAPPAKWSEQHVSAAQDAIFLTLARLAWDALKSERSLREPPADSGNPPSVATSTASAECGDRGRGKSDKSSPLPSPLPPQPDAAPSEPVRLVFLGSIDRHNGNTQQGSEADAVMKTPNVDLRQRSEGDKHVGGNRGACEARGAAQQEGRADKKKPAAVPVAASPADNGKRPLLLFNEQYVVKPPSSFIEFGWHTDEREQLAMCVFSPGVHPPVYVSVWLALDDCDTANGCLEVYPQPWNQPRLRAPSDEDEAGIVCIPAKAGDAVVFLSNLWHRSGPNRTDEARRVFYAQYSCQVICATPSDPRPLSLAVPCSLFPLPPAMEHPRLPRPGSDDIKGRRAPEAAVDNGDDRLAKAAGPTPTIGGAAHLTPRGEDDVRWHMEAEHDRKDTLVLDGASTIKRARGLSTSTL